nr:hypothetical protein CFP56_70147 [Quercus suber]
MVATCSSEATVEIDLMMGDVGELRRGEDRFARCCRSWWRLVVVQTTVSAQPRRSLNPHLLLHHDHTTQTLVHRHYAQLLRRSQKLRRRRRCTPALQRPIHPAPAHVGQRPSAHISSPHLMIIAAAYPATEVDCEAECALAVARS